MEVEAGVGLQRTMTLQSSGGGSCLDKCFSDAGR